MSDVSGYRQRLGVGRIIGDTFSIFFQRFGLMFLLALIPAIIAMALVLVLQPIMIRQAAADPTMAIIAGVVLYVVNLFAYSLSTSLIVLAAFDTKINRPGRLGVYFRWALANLFTVVVLSIAVALMVFLVLAVPMVVLGLILAAAGSGQALLVIVVLIFGIAALYVFAMFSPYVPAIVVEGAGFGALGRAARLTSGYRWPVVGILVVLFLVLFLIGIVLGLLVAGLSQVGGVWLGALAQIAASAISGGIFSVGVAVIYARLREVKEGMTVDSLADVFQ